MNWRSVKRCVVAGIMALWLGNAVLAAAAMKQALPALNPLGMAYIGLTAPAAMICHELGYTGCMVPPPRYSQYFFTF